MALLLWVGSVVALFLFQFIALIAFFAVRFLIEGKSPDLQLTPSLALVSLVGTMVAHIVTLAISWWIVTSGGQHRFFERLGWRWHHQFKWVHAVALALIMLALAFAFERFLPHGDTDFEKLLRLSGSVRIAVAILAVFSAPLVEEIVYRGVLYTAIAGVAGWKVGVAVVTVLFAFVHAFQYWGSPAAIAAILSLSLVLTVLRAATGQLLPCVATHFVFNGIQAAVLIVAPPTRPDSTATTAFRALGGWLGIDL